MKVLLTLALAAVAAAVMPATAAGSQAHEHGVAQLDVVVEPERVVFDLDTPLDNVVGFERAPRTDAERERVKAVLARLRDAAALFRIDAAAGCTVSKVELLAPALQAGADAKEAHAGLQGHYEFSCKTGSKAGFVELGLFEALATLRRIDLQVVTPRGQLKARLNKPATRVVLVR